MQTHLGEFKPLDPGRVDTVNPLEMAYWCREFDCSEAQLIDAVERVGEHVTEVREALSEARSS